MLKISKLAIYSNISSRSLLYTCLDLTCSRLAVILITFLSARMFALDPRFEVLSEWGPNSYGLFNIKQKGALYCSYSFVENLSAWEAIYFCNFTSYYEMMGKINHHVVVIGIQNYSFFQIKMKKIFHINYYVSTVFCAFIGNQNWGNT